MNYGCLKILKDENIYLQFQFLDKNYFEKENLISENIKKYEAAFIRSDYSNLNLTFSKNEKESIPNKILIV